MSEWRAPHRLVLALAAVLLAGAGALAAAALAPGHAVHGSAVAVLALGGVLLAVVGVALRPRPADAPSPPPEPTWFPASTDFARSALAPDTALPELDPAARPACARCGSPMVERSASRQRGRRWMCADAPRCVYTVEEMPPASGS